VPGRQVADEDAETLAFEAFGVRIGVEVEGSGLIDRVRQILPPGSRPCRPEGIDPILTLRAEASPSTWKVSRRGEALASELPPESALELLERELRTLVALDAPEHVFVHAGVVGHRGAAIVIPGSSLSGKSTLTAELVRAGGEYYSDEYAPLDASGLVHPFPKPLSIRNERFVQVDHHVDALGGVAGEDALPVGLVAITHYESGADWHPRRLSSGEGALAVLSHTVPAQSRPAQALETIGRALEGALILEGVRGEADTLAPSLLAELERA
jgi:hypothetical protein